MKNQIRIIWRKSEKSELDRLLKGNMKNQNWIDYSWELKRQDWIDYWGKNEKTDWNAYRGDE